MAAINSPFFCRTIEEATKHPLYDDCREEMIARHHARMAKKNLEKHEKAGYWLEYAVADLPFW